MMAAMQRVEHGEAKEKIDEAARIFGMPMGPIELADAVGLDVCAHVGKILKMQGDGDAAGRLVEQRQLGKKTGEGFYVWKDGKPERGQGSVAQGRVGATRPRVGGALDRRSAEGAGRGRRRQR